MNCKLTSRNLLQRRNVARYDRMPVRRLYNNGGNTSQSGTSAYRMAREYARVFRSNRAGGAA